LLILLKSNTFKEIGGFLLREENVNLIVKAVKDFRESQNLEELLKIIKGYSELGFDGDVRNRMVEFLEKGGNFSDLMSIVDTLPEGIREIMTTGELEIDGEFDADSFLEMGELLWEIGSPEEAKDNYIKAFEYYSMFGNKNAAEQVLKTLKENYPKDARISNMVYEEKQNNILPSLKAFTVKSPKDEVDLRYALGKAFHEADLLPEAEANYRRVLELDKSHNSKRLLVALLREQGSLGDALGLARELQGMDKLEELYSIYEALKNSGKSKIGKDVLQEIYEINPDFKDVKDLLGILPEEKIEEEKVEAGEKFENVKETVSTDVVGGEAERKESVPKDEDFKDQKIVFL
jgi:tetratricopeptide (TPR) repeat protein